MTGDLMLSKAIEGFLMARGADGYSADTLVQYKWAWKKVLAVVDKPLEAVDIGDLRRAMTAIQSKGLSSQSVFHVWKAIKAFYKWASAEGSGG